MMITRAVLVKQLKEGLKRAERHDKAVLREHTKEMAAWEKSLRTEITRALKLPTKEFGEWADSLHGYRTNSTRAYFNPPDCPISQAHQFEQAIARVELDKRDTFNLTHKNLEYLQRLIEWNPDNDAKVKVC